MSAPVPLYVLRTGTVVEHLGDAVGDALILGTPLRVWQAQAAHWCGLEARFVDHVGQVTRPALVMEDYTFITRRALHSFALAAQSCGKDARAVVAFNPALDAVFAGHRAQRGEKGWRYGLRYLAAQPTPEVELEVRMPDLKHQFLHVPAVISRDGRAPIYRTAFGVSHIHSVLHLYQANMHAVAAAAMDRTAKFKRGPPPASLAACNRLGPGCVIHPSAVVENCDVGPGTLVGALAVCRDSVLGAGVTVWDAAVIQSSWIGDQAMVGHQYRVMMSAMYPQSFATSGALQFSLLGRGAAVFAAWITDVRMDGKTVRFPVGDRVEDSGMAYLGCMVGHGARITAGVITAPGRVVPNGSLVQVDPALVYKGHHGKAGAAE